jgi:multiple sugar transport system ATP-binding protein
VANFIGSTPMNLVPGQARDGGIELLGGRVARPRGVADGERVTVGIRPEYLAISSKPVEEGAFTGQVSVIEHLGTTSLVAVEVDGTLVGATVPDGEEPEAGSTVWLRPVPERVLVYRDGDGSLIG